MAKARTTQLREFGFVVAGGLTLIFGVLGPWLRHHPAPSWLWIVNSVLVALALLAPRALDPLERLWLRLGLLLGVLATWLAFAVNFLLQSLITMGCFWTERASALDRLLFIPYLFLSGISAPLETFPEGVRRLALATPFPYLLHFPARVLAGEPVELLQGFAALLGWAAVLLPLVLGLWRLGVRRYGAMGA